ncbi:MAG: hypothetical protein KDA81_14460 [Planctomycetaceae bacterium]|nr:hypothetical protein [Planctomycetaceae bacterium]
MRSPNNGRLPPPFDFAPTTQVPDGLLMVAGLFNGGRSPPEPPPPLI